MVPLCIENEDPEEDPCVFMNRLCNSALSFRLLRFEFENETPEQTKEEMNRMESEMDGVDSSFLYKNNSFPGLEIEFMGHSTMNDQKVLAVMAGRKKPIAACNCFLCRATPTLILKNNPAKFLIKKANLKFLDRGFSGTHYWIRAGEMIFNVGFKRFFKTFSITDDEADILWVGNLESVGKSNIKVSGMGI